MKELGRIRFANGFECEARFLYHNFCAWLNKRCPFYELRLRKDSKESIAYVWGIETDEPQTVENVLLTALTDAFTFVSIVGQSDDKAEAMALYTAQVRRAFQQISFGIDDLTTCVKALANKQYEKEEAHDQA